ncbi:MAG: hypothetical protein JWO81_392 [Alphaproteobacteria bacterium]|nr:hypothetical protein [Alphaproteobacteria bacterium]
MSEPESLATIEGVDEHVRRHSYDRLIMLSDGIFAIATTLAALDVRLPTRGGLIELIVAGRRSLLVYFLSFVIAGIFWISNRNLFARLRRVDLPLTILTLAMLCLIALIPAMIRTVYLESGGEARLSLYGLTMFACGLLNTLMWGYAAFRPGLMLPGVSRSEKWVRFAAAAALPLLFLPVLLIPPDRLATVMLPLAVLLVLLRRIVLPKWLRRAGLR